MALMSANCIICERALQEKDSVISAMRIVDIFFAKPLPGIPIEQQAIPVTFVGIVRLTADDSEPHSISLTMNGPERDPKSIPIMQNQVVPHTKFPAFPRMAGVLGQLGVVPRFGLYEVTLIFDGQEVAKTQFTLAESPSEQSPTVVDSSPSDAPRERLQ